MVYYKSRETIYRGYFMISLFIFMISLFVFIIFTIGGIIGEETDDDKTIKFCFKLIKLLSFIGTTYSLICIYLMSIIK